MLVSRRRVCHIETTAPGGIDGASQLHANVMPPSAAHADGYRGGVCVTRASNASGAAVAKLPGACMSHNVMLAMN